MGRRFCAVQVFSPQAKTLAQAESISAEHLKLRVEAASGRRNPKRRTALRLSFFLVTRRGFEPRTHCLKGSCSAD